VSRFPRLLSKCTISWFHSWPTEAYVDIATEWLADFSADCTPEVKTLLCRNLASVHQQAVDMSAVCRHRSTFWQSSAHLFFLNSYLASMACYIFNFVKLLNKLWLFVLFSVVTSAVPAEKLTYFVFSWESAVFRKQTLFAVIERLFIHELVYFIVVYRLTFGLAITAFMSIVISDWAYCDACLETDVWCTSAQCHSSRSWTCTSRPMCSDIKTSRIGCRRLAKASRKLRRRCYPSQSWKSFLLRRSRRLLLKPPRPTMRWKWYVSPWTCL